MRLVPVNPVRPPLIGSSLTHMYSACYYLSDALLRLQQLWHRPTSHERHPSWSCRHLPPTSRCSYNTTQITVIELLLRVPSSSLDLIANAAEALPSGRPLTSDTAGVLPPPFSLRPVKLIQGHVQHIWIWDAGRVSSKYLYQVQSCVFLALLSRVFNIFSLEVPLYYLANTII